MLLQFTVENYLSFDEKVVFSMRASGDRDHPNHIITGKIPLLRGAAIYGANAAGKSNLVLAMGFARDFIASRGTASTSLSDVRAFGLRENAGRPSVFGWLFLHAGKIWNYSFSIESGRVVEESLYARAETGGHERKWFERTTGEDGVVEVSLGEEFLNAKTKTDGKLLKLIRSRTPPEELFLCYCRGNKIAAVTPVFEWFEDVLLVVRAEADYEPLVLEANENKSFLQFLSDHVRDAGTGIDSIECSELLLGEEFVREFVNLQPEKENRLREFLASIAPGETTLNLNRKVGAFWELVRRDEEGQLFFTRLAALHRTKDGELCEFKPDWESEGTQRYLHLLPRLYQLQTRPTVLIIDELERRLHTLLTRRLVEQALNVSSQARSQFIFTTHDTNLLDSELLRRDEIWFVDKDESGASSLTSLAEYKIRSDSDYEKGYLLGRFEAIPYFRNSHKLATALEGSK